MIFIFRCSTTLQTDKPERKVTNKKLDVSPLNWFIRYVLYSTIAQHHNIYKLIIAGPRGKTKSPHRKHVLVV